MKQPFIISALVILFTNISCAQEVPTISPKEVKARIDQGTNAVLLDVRRQEEIDRGVIDKDIIAYDFYHSAFKDNLVKLDKDKTYYVYCHAGGRSGKTVKMMQELGFKNVFNVEGGITQWKAEGMELVEKD